MPPTVKGGDDDRTVRIADTSTPLIFPLVVEPARRRRWVGKATAGILLGTLLAGAAVAALGQLNSAPARGGQVIDGSGAELQRDRTGDVGGQVSVFELEPGTCLKELADGAAVQTVSVVACEEQHAAEVLASLRMPGGRWPGAAAVEDFATAQCVPAIHSAGVAADPDLRWTYFGPSESSWETRSDRTVSCVVVSRGAALTGSVINTQNAQSPAQLGLGSESGERP
jgi:hypothetical protein